MSRRISAREWPIENDLKSNWPFHLKNFTWFLIQCRRYFNGDMDRLLIFCVISARNLSPKDMLVDPGHGRLGEKFLNLQSITDCSGLPRETARRKLQDLMALGWVARDERGNSVTTAKAATDLEPLTKLGIQYLTQMKDLLLQREDPEGKAA